MWWRPHANDRVRIPIDERDRETALDRRSLLRRLLSSRHGAGEVVVRRAAVIRLLRLPQRETAAPTPPKGMRRSPAQVKREQARRAIEKVYPQGVPDQATVPNLGLIDAIRKQLMADGVITKRHDIGDDTILRAAGRKKG
jgi:hypothetical protein